MSACKKLPNTATKQELRDAHRVKMAAKKIVRERIHKQFKADWESYKEYIDQRARNLITHRQHVL